MDGESPACQTEGNIEYSERELSPPMTVAPTPSEATASCEEDLFDKTDDKHDLKLTPIKLAEIARISVVNCD